jgi:hypothetical protein
MAVRSTNAWSQNSTPQNELRNLSLRTAVLRIDDRQTLSRSLRDRSASKDRGRMGDIVRAHSGGGQVHHLSFTLMSDRGTLNAT